MTYAPNKAQRVLRAPRATLPSVRVQIRKILHSGSQYLIFHLTWHKYMNIPLTG